MSVDSVRTQYVLPHAQNDELLYGIVSRLAAFHGLRRLEPLLRRAGTNYSRIAVHGSVGIHWLVTSPPYADARAVIADLLEKHSALRYLMVLIPPTRYARYRRVLTSAAPRQAHALATRMFTVRPFGKLQEYILRWCPACIAHESARGGSPYWHLSHQMPCTFVCSQHNLWLGSTSPANALIPGPSRALSATEPPSLSESALALLYSLARNDAAILAFSDRGYFGRTLRLHYARALALPRNRLAEQRVAVTQALESLDREEWAPLRALLKMPFVQGGHARQLADLLLDEEDKRQHPGAHAIFSALLGIDLHQLFAAACPTSGELREELCGSRFCSRYQPDWPVVLRRRSGGATADLVGECSECGFSAREPVGAEYPQVTSVGKAASTVVNELRRDGIREYWDVARILGIPLADAEQLLAGMPSR